eukprot:82204-Prymnesium_polylepis.1
MPGPLAPSLVDQVVHHVIVVGRVTCRRARPSGDRSPKGCGPYGATRRRVFAPIDLGSSRGQCPT